MKSREEAPGIGGGRVSAGRLVLIVAPLLLLIVGTRAPHIAGPIDLPQDWRQADTAFYAYDFYQNGVDLLHPSVCWMGGYKTKILEFPLPEAAMAAAFRLFGPHLFVARLVTLLFFTGSAAYLFLIVRRFSDDWLATLATGAYVILPLSQFYSRAVHIDFAVLFCAHAMVFHLLRAFDRPWSLDAAAASVAAILGFLIKAPYVFYFALPLLCVAAGRRDSRRAMALVGGCMLLATSCFLIWRRHTYLVNVAAPDWDFLPQYGKMVNMANWYYGPMEMRLEADVWARILDRFQHQVTGAVGLWFFLAGCAAALFLAFGGRWKRVLPLWAWLAGTIVYVAVFLNLNYQHDYYQIPFLAVSSVFIALGLDLPQRLIGDSFPRSARVISIAALLLLAGTATGYAESNYYTRDLIRDRAGETIASNTPADALLVSAGDLPKVGVRDPRILFRASRVGWSLHVDRLSAAIIERLRAEGATHLSIVVKGPYPQDEVFGIPVRAHSLGYETWEVLIGEL